MTRDQILKLASDAGFSVTFQHHESEAIINFAALVAAHEREECAKVCETLNGTSSRRCAEAIRARGQK